MTSQSSGESLSLTRHVFVFCLLAATAFAAGPKERTLYNFQAAPDGINPQAPLLAGGGHLYGTTITGGAGTVCQDLYSTGCGAVFELTPPASPGGSWTEKVIYSFQGGSDGALPSGQLLRDGAGNLYGTTMAGGSSGLFCTGFQATGCGTVFRLSPPQTAGGDWTESIVYVFQGGSDGKEPFNAGLISDGKGKLYGTRSSGGGGYCSGLGTGCGSVFRLSQPATPGGPWTETILYGFNGNGGNFSDGAFPAASLVFDQKGNLYGTTFNDGPGGCSDESCGGTIFRLSPPAVDGDPWTETLLAYFGSGTTNNDSFPSGRVIFDQKGNLYGTTKLGGSGACDDQSSYAFPSCGTVFGLSPTTSGVWTLTTLYSFTGGSDGGYPEGGLTMDSKGNLYGIAPKGGGQGSCTLISGISEFGCGTVFELTPPATTGAAWTETTLHAFSGSDGATPNAGLILKNGVLYGTTSGTGMAIQFPINNGTVFAILP